MKSELLHIGFGGVIAANRILVIVSPDSAPVKRMIKAANDQSLIHRYDSRSKDESSHRAG